MKKYPEVFQKTLLLTAQKVVYNLDRLGIGWIMCGGTLLGAVRSGKFIEHDYDIDFETVGPNTNSEYDKLLELISYIRSHPEEGLRVEDKLPYLIKFGPLVPKSMVHMFQFNRPGVPNPTVDLFISTSTPTGRKLISPLWPNWNYLTSELSPILQLKFEGCLWRAPAHPEGILERYYGPNWRTPIFQEWPLRKKTSSTTASPPCQPSASDPS